MDHKNKISKFIILIVISILFNFSCQQKSNISKIEIYTINEQSLDKEDVLDSINKKIIYAPKFEVSENMLSKTPLILNEEIICIDTISSKIKLSADAINKIVTIKPSMKHGIKFAICNNRKPIMTGYFWSSFSSYGSTWNCIEYNHTEKLNKTMSLNFYKGNGMDASKREKINFANYKDIVKIFKESGRIECESN